MAKRPRYTLIFAPQAIGHMALVERKYHGLLQRVIDEQLTFVPAGETRNRKPLDPPAPFSASWELRCGPDNRFRVFYDVDSEVRTVNVLAIAVKDRNHLLIGGEEYVL